jgi:hypothetical protein
VGLQLFKKNLGVESRLINTELGKKHKKRKFGRSRRREDNIKMVLRQMHYKDVYWSEQAPDTVK